MSFDTRRILGLIVMAHSEGDSKHTAVLELVLNGLELESSWEER